MKFDNAVRGSKYHGEGHYGNINHGIEGRHAGVDSGDIHWKPVDYSSRTSMSIDSVISQFTGLKINYNKAWSAVDQIFPNLLQKLRIEAESNPSKYLCDFLRDNKKSIDKGYYARYLKYLNRDI